MRLLPWMDPQRGHDDDVLCWHGNAAVTKGGLDFFSEPMWFPMAAASSGGRGDCHRRASAGVDGLDLNLQVDDFPENMSYLDLLGSSSAAAVGEGDRGSTGRGTEHGVVHPAGRGAGGARANVRGAGLSANRTSGTTVPCTSACTRTKQVGGPNIQMVATKRGLILCNVSLCTMGAGLHLHRSCTSACLVACTS